MNLNFRTVWNEALSAWTTVAETVSAKGKTAGVAAIAGNRLGVSPRLRRLPLAAALLTLFSLSDVNAQTKMWVAASVPA